MVKRSKGFSSKGTKATRFRKKLTVNDLIRPFNPGDSVVIAIKSYFKGLPHSRYNGRGGKIVEKRGGCYIVRVRDGKMMKNLTISPVHLNKVKK